MQAFAIRNKSTGEWWKASSTKKVWTTEGAAKTVWNYSHKYIWDKEKGGYKRNREQNMFDKQTEYEIVRLIPEN